MLAPIEHRVEVVARRWVDCAGCDTPGSSRYTRYRYVWLAGGLGTVRVFDRYDCFWCQSLTDVCVAFGPANTGAAYGC